MKFDIKKDGMRLAVICLAAVIMAVNIKSFVRTGGLYPGGATGLTLLLQRVFELWFHVELPYTLVNVILNAFPVYLGFRFIGKKFTLYSVLMIMLTNLLTDFLPAFPITYDTLLISIFGGLINGFVISLCLAMNATTGGTDFIAIYLSEKKEIDAWNMVLVLNVFILAAAGLLFGWDKALYSIIFQFASTQVVHMLNPRYKRTTLFIISDKSEQIYEQIRGSTHHGATLFQGTGLYNGEPRSMIYSVIAGDQVKKVTRAVRAIDPKAFVNILKTDQVAGNFYQRPND